MLIVVMWCFPFLVGVCSYYCSGVVVSVQVCGGVFFGYFSWGGEFKCL